MSDDTSRRLDLPLAAAAERPGCTEECCTAPAGTSLRANAIDPQRRGVLSRRIQLLVTATISYNIIEAIVAISAGAVASSTALIGFGLDSVIEVASAAAVAWQFSGKDSEARERSALKVIAVSFFALAAYVTVESVRSLLAQIPPSTQRSGSSWRRCRCRSCRCCPMRSGAPGASWARPAQWPTQNKPCCAPTCRVSC